MLTLQFRTKGNASPQGKRKVFFTCHPADYKKSFEKILGDLWKNCDCAVYFTADPDEEISDEDYRLQIGQMNLMVIPVSFKLLREENRAMQRDFAFAQETHIPVLPIMLEPGLDAFYADKFGKLQYLDPNASDTTGLSYEEKLKNYLSAVLTDDGTAARVRAAFDAYIFLSYRKKDRAHADALMRLIHKNPMLRDIAIWYDEYLTPGENFDKNIEKYLNKSQLFALLVTPNLLEKPDGKPNFVMGVEYPAARREGKPILPAEAVETDRKKLEKDFENIPPCADAKDAESFFALLLQALGSCVNRENDADPEHLFLIGLAYLEGIDVETDRERGVELITQAGEAGLPEAMVKLRDMYRDGYGVTLNYETSLYWAEKYADYCLKTYGGGKQGNTLRASRFCFWFVHPRRQGAE